MKHFFRLLPILVVFGAVAIGIGGTGASAATNGTPCGPGGRGYILNVGGQAVCLGVYKDYQGQPYPGSTYNFSAR